MCLPATCSRRATPAQARPLPVHTHIYTYVYNIYMLTLCVYTVCMPARGGLPPRRRALSPYTQIERWMDGWRDGWMGMIRYVDPMCICIYARWMDGWMDMIRYVGPMCACIYASPCIHLCKRSVT